MAKGLSPMALWGLATRAPDRGARTRGRCMVSGALAEQLAKELSPRRGARRRPRRTAVSRTPRCLIRLLAGAPTEEDEQELRAAKRAKVPVVAVQTGTEDFDIPYVLATDVVKCRPGEGFPVEEIAARRRRAARRGGHRARRRGVPVLREPLCEALIESFSRQERDPRRGDLRPRRRLPRPDPEPDPARASARRRARRRGRPAAAARGARDVGGRIRLPCRRAPAARRDSRRRLGWSRAASPTAARVRSARPRSATSTRSTADGRRRATEPLARARPGPGPSYGSGNRRGGRRDGRFRARGRAASDRRSRRLVRVPRGHASAERDALRRGRALGLGPPLPAAARRSRPPRTASPRNAA